MPLQVIGAGLGRTGTFTLKTALEKLGLGPCHHMVEVLANPHQVPFWNRAADGEAVEWDEVFADYRSSVDWPSCHFYAELANYYPEARVVLSKRDPGQWYDSMSATILKSMGMMGFVEGQPVPEDHPMRFGGVIIADRTFDHDYSRDNVIAAFERHVTGVRRTIAPERLLEFDPAEGWEPLCALLGVEVPDEPFPHTNRRDRFWDHVKQAQELSGR